MGSMERGINLNWQRPNGRWSVNMWCSSSNFSYLRATHVYRADDVFSATMGSAFSRTGDEDSSLTSVILPLVACPPFPLRSLTTPLSVWAMLCRPSHKGNSPTQKALQNNHRIPTVTQPVKNYMLSVIVRTFVELEQEENSPSD